MSSGSTLPPTGGLRFRHKRAGALPAAIGLGLACLVAETIPALAFDAGGTVSTLLNGGLKYGVGPDFFGPPLMADPDSIEAQRATLNKRFEFVENDLLRIRVELGRKTTELRLAGYHLERAKSLQAKYPSAEASQDLADAQKEVAKLQTEVKVLKKAQEERIDDLKRLNNESRELDKKSSSRDSTSFESRVALGYAGGETLPRSVAQTFAMFDSNAGASAPRRLAFFATLGGSAFKDTDTVDRDGNVIAVSTGARLRLNDAVSVGAAFNFGDGNSHSNLMNSDLDHQTYGVGMFVNARIFDGATLDFGARYDHGNADATFGISTYNGVVTTASFDTDAFSVGGRLARKFWWRPTWWVEPQATVSYTSLQRGAFTDSAGTYTQSDTLELGRLGAGARIGRPFYGASDGAPFGIDHGLIYLGAGGAWDFASEDNFLVAVSTTNVYAHTSKVGAKLSAGLEATWRNGATVAFSAQSVLLGDYYTFGGFGSLSVPIN